LQKPQPVELPGIKIDCKMRKYRIDKIIVGAGDVGGVNIPDKAVVVQIKNMGTHGAIDMAFINETWEIPGGESEYPAQFSQSAEQDETKWEISWASTAIDLKVIFMYKIYID